MSDEVLLKVLVVLKMLLVVNMAWFCFWVFDMAYTHIRGR